MKIKEASRISCFAIIALLILISCSGEQKLRRPLLFSVDSYTPIEEVRLIVSKLGGEWTVIESNVLDSGDSRPRFEILRFKTDIFIDQLYRGETVFSFFNDQLMSVEFRPADRVNYSKYIRNKLQVKIESPMLETVEDGVRTTIVKSYIKKEDVYIRREVDAWISKYS